MIDLKSYIGIDPGLDGGIVKIDEQGEIVVSAVMPTLNRPDGKRVIWIDMLNRMLRYHATNSTVIIEDPGGHAPSASGLRSMTYSFAVAEALCVAHHVNYYTVNAKTWQRDVMERPKLAKGEKWDTKAAAFERAKSLWPYHEFRQRGKRGALLKHPHDGVVDAALIAYYGQTNQL
jgi:hypothetical protein